MGHFSEQAIRYPSAREEWSADRFGAASVLPADVEEAAERLERPRFYVERTHAAARPASETLDVFGDE